MMAEPPVASLLAFQFEVRMTVPGSDTSELMLQSPPIAN
jgi:hypothetical protein